MELGRNKKPKPLMEIVLDDEVLRGSLVEKIQAVIFLDHAWGYMLQECGGIGTKFIHKALQELLK